MKTALNYSYTKKEIEKLLDTMTILVDKREKKINHILKYFEKANINYENATVRDGDYSFYLPKNKELGIMRDTNFNQQFVIERKRNINELARNCSSRRKNFERQLMRNKESKFILLVEDPEGYKNIIMKNYRRDYNPKAFMASLNTFEIRYNISINFINREFIGNFIRWKFYYYLREYLL